MLTSPTRKIGFILYTVVASVITAIAAWTSAALGFEVWVMFMGFIAWFTRPTSLRNELSSLFCLWLGIGLALVSALATHALVPFAGSLALALVVFAVAMVIMSLRKIDLVSNLTCWYLGLVIFFAADAPLEFGPLAKLFAATASGGIAGWACQVSTARWHEA